MWGPDMKKSSPCIYTIQIADLKIFIPQLSHEGTALCDQFKGIFYSIKTTKSYTLLILQLP